MKSLIKYIPYFIITVIALGLVFVSLNNEKRSPASSAVTDDAPLIIIDAGHGGADGGAVAADGTEEQYINLDIAIRLNDILTSLGYRTLMTRIDNNSIHDSTADTMREQKVSDLHNRLKIIESNPDCIFVSVHQNYYTESKYWGTQVFYSPNNAQSSVLAQSVQSSVVSGLQPDNTRQIKQSGSSIYLLYNATAPAVMVECGFLSNREETAKLNDIEYRQQMAEAISCGIVNYINGGEHESETAE